VGGVRLRLGQSTLAGISSGSMVSDLRYYRSPVWRPQVGGRDDLMATLAAIPASKDGDGFLSHVVPALGFVGLVVGVGLKLHPATKIPAVLLGVGLAVINWGASPVGAGIELDESTHEPGWLNVPTVW